MAAPPCNCILPVTPAPAPALAHSPEVMHWDVPVTVLCVIYGVMISGLIMFGGYRLPTKWLEEHTLQKIKKIGLCVCFMSLVVSAGIVQISATDDKFIKLSNKVGAILDLISSVVACWLAFALMLQVPNRGTGVGFIAGLVFASFKMGAAYNTFWNEDITWQMYSTIGIVGALATFYPQIYELNRHEHEEMVKRQNAGAVQLARRL